jgi:hypothetical protein
MRRRKVGSKVVFPAFLAGRRNKEDLDCSLGD